MTWVEGLQRWTTLIRAQMESCDVLTPLTVVGPHTAGLAAEGGDSPRMADEVVVLEQHVQLHTDDSSDIPTPHSSTNVSVPPKTGNARLWRILWRRNSGVFKTLLLTFPSLLAASAFMMRGIRSWMTTTLSSVR